MPTEFMRKQAVWRQYASPCYGYLCKQFTQLQGSTTANNCPGQQSETSYDNNLIEKQCYGKQTWDI